LRQLADKADQVLAKLDDAIRKVGELRQEQRRLRRDALLAQLVVVLAFVVGLWYVVQLP
jgi:hypothetical protein